MNITAKTAFCGEHGAFAELALFQAFGEDAETLPTPSFDAVFEAVFGGSAQFGVVPIENSLAGSIRENYDTLMQYPDIAIVGELTLRVVHCLIVHPDAGWDTIKTVRSHPQALAQCKVFLDSHPDWVREAWSNTAVAVGSIPHEGDERLHIAAIASDVAARLKGLKVLREGIETNSANYTRFCVISRKQGGVPNYPPGPAKAHNKASVVCSIKDEPGSLYSCLQALTERKINLSKIESRPIHGQPWHYRFYLDVVIPPEPGVFEAAIEALKAHTEDFHLLGSYRAAE